MLAASQSICVYVHNCLLPTKKSEDLLHRGDDDDKNYTLSTPTTRLPPLATQFGGHWVTQTALIDEKP